MGMLFHIINFLVDYFTNLNAKKIFGGILVLIGFAITSKIPSNPDLNTAMLYGAGGILLGGIGFIIIYYDIAKDKAAQEYNELQTIVQAHKDRQADEKKVAPANKDSERS